MGGLGTGWGGWGGWGGNVALAAPVTAGYAAYAPAYTTAAYAPAYTTAAYAVTPA